MRPRSALEAHQLGMIEKTKHPQTPRVAEWADMGSGKTASVLTAFVDLQARFDAYRMLVIAPLRVAQSVWHDECREWEHLAHLRVLWLSGGGDTIIRTIERAMAETDIMTISCDSVHVLAKAYLGRPAPWDWIVVDEASRFKTYGTRRARSLRLLTQYPRQPLRVTELTGTPAANGIADVHEQIYMLDRGARLGASMAEFKRRFYRTASGGVGQAPDKLSVVRIQKAIADLVHVVLPEDLPKRPQPRLNPIKLDMGKALLEQYQQFKRKYVLELCSGGRITAVNSAAIGKKLLQFASGTVYDAEHVPRYIHSVKLDALKEIVEDNEGKPLLVAYGYRHEIATIRKAFPKAELLGDDPEQIRKWNAGQIPIFLAHPKSVGHGLNLQFGGHILVWYSYDYNLEEHQQTNKRLPRLGQKNEVIINYLVMRKTADELVIASLNSKDNVQVSFQKGVKKLIQETLNELGIST